MIDLRDIYHRDDFKKEIETFKVERRWNVFNKPFLNATNNKCPYCEVMLPNNLENRKIEATIDHFRPQDYYPTLRQVYQNYILMCNDCNNAYKKNSFLVYEKEEVVKIEKQVTKRENIESEKAIIVNPIKDNIFDIFILRFKLTNRGKILELYPKYKESENRYLHFKAKETIKLFALGDCETIDNSKEYNRCRVILLKQHFNLLYDFVVALNKKDKEQASKIFKEKKLKEYGFIDFIKQKLFKVEV